MPRAFNEHEQAAIRDRLVEAGRAAFPVRGLRGVGVDELARAAGISKGGFYLFYASKDDLFLDVLDRVETAARARLAAEVRAAPDRAVEVLLRAAVAVPDAEPMLGRAVLDDAALVLRGRPERMAAMLRDDVDFTARVLADVRAAGVDPGVDAEVLTGLSRALFYLHTHRDEIGATVYPAVADVLVRGAAAAVTTPRATRAERDRAGGSSA